MQTSDEVERSPSISKQEFSKDAPQVAAKTKRKKVQKKEEEKTTDKIPKEACAPQTAAKQEEQDDDMPDEETMDFIKELHNLARKGMCIMRNCPPETKNRKLLSQEERKEIYIESLDPTRTKFQTGTQYLSEESDLVRFQDSCKEASCTVGEATILENHWFVTDGIPVNILPQHMFVFTKGFKSKEHNGQWGVLEAYNPQRQRLQIFILKTEAEVWIKPENISIATDIDAAKKKGKEDDAKKDKEAPSNGS